MIIVLKQGSLQEKINNLKEYLESNYKVTVNSWVGVQSTVLGVLGDTSNIDIDYISAQNIVESVKRVQGSFKKSNRKFHPNDTIIKLKSGENIGNGEISLIAGPCSVESEEQIYEIARSVKKSGAKLLRAGAFKPRTSPYSFQGLREDGIKILSKVKKDVKIPIITEIMSISHIDLFEDIDIIQVGARNMQNFELLKELGHTSKPILLKRGFSNTIEELLMSAEHIMAAGNQNVILCERGIRTFETFTRNTLDISAIPILKKISHLPIIVDPSHAAGVSWLVESLSLASIAAGADGIMLEVHNDPSNALSDGSQSIDTEQFEKISKKVFKMSDLIRNI